MEIASNIKISNFIKILMNKILKNINSIIKLYASMSYLLFNFESKAQLFF